MAAPPHATELLHVDSKQNFLNGNFLNDQKYSEGFDLINLSTGVAECPEKPAEAVRTHHQCCSETVGVDSFCTSTYKDYNSEWNHAQEECAIPKKEPICLPGQSMDAFHTPEVKAEDLMDSKPVDDEEPSLPNSDLETMYNNKWNHAQEECAIPKKEPICLPGQSMNAFHTPEVKAEDLMDSEPIEDEEPSLLPNSDLEMMFDTVQRSLPMEVTCNICGTVLKNIENNLKTHFYYHFGQCNPSIFLFNGIFCPNQGNNESIQHTNKCEEQKMEFELNGELEECSGQLIEKCLPVSTMNENDCQSQAEHVKQEGFVAVVENFEPQESVLLQQFRNLKDELLRSETFCNVDESVSPLCGENQGTSYHLDELPAKNELVTPKDGSDLNPICKSQASVTENIEVVDGNLIDHSDSGWHKVMKLDLFVNKMAGSQGTLVTCRLCTRDFKFRDEDSMINGIDQHIFAVHLNKPAFACNRCSYMGHFIHIHYAEHHPDVPILFGDLRPLYMKQFVHFLQNCFGESNNNNRMRQIEAECRKLIDQCNSDWNNKLVKLNLFVKKFLTSHGKSIVCTPCNRDLNFEGEDTMMNAIDHHFFTVHLNKPAFACKRCSYMGYWMNLHYAEHHPWVPVTFSDLRSQYSKQFVEFVQNCIGMSSSNDQMRQKCNAVEVRKKQNQFSSKVISLRDRTQEPSNSQPPAKAYVQVVDGKLIDHPDSGWHKLVKLDLFVNKMVASLKKSVTCRLCMRDFNFEDRDSMINGIDQHIFAVHLNKPAFACKRCSYMGYWIHFHNSQRHPIVPVSFGDLRPLYFKQFAQFLQTCFGESNSSDQMMGIEMEDRKLIDHCDSDWNELVKLDWFINKMVASQGMSMTCRLCTRDFNFEDKDVMMNAISHHIFTVHLNVPAFECKSCSYSGYWMCLHYAKHHPSVPVSFSDLRPLYLKQFAQFVEKCFGKSCSNDQIKQKCNAVQTRKRQKNHFSSKAISSRDRIQESSRSKPQAKTNVQVVDGQLIDHPDSGWHKLVKLDLFVNEMVALQGMSVTCRLCMRDFNFEDKDLMINGIDQHIFAVHLNKPAFACNRCSYVGYWIQIHCAQHHPAVPVSSSDLRPLYLKEFAQFLQTCFGESSNNNDQIRQKCNTVRVGKKPKNDFTSRTMSSSADIEQIKAQPSAKRSN